MSWKFVIKAISYCFTVIRWEAILFFCGEMLIRTSCVGQGQCRALMYILPTQTPSFPKTFVECSGTNLPTILSDNSDRFSKLPLFPGSLSAFLFIIFLIRFPIFYHFSLLSIIASTMLGAVTSFNLSMPFRSFLHRVYLKMVCSGVSSCPQ